MLATPPQPFLVETPRLKLLIDSPDISVWQRFLGTGLFNGVTTNPKLLAQAGYSCTVPNLKQLAEAAFELGAGEIHLQVWGLEAQAMIEIGQQLAEIEPRVMVKVPATIQGFIAAHTLIGQGVNVTLTAMHASYQILAAIALGARYAVPYLGRMSDAGKDAIAEVIAMQEILNYHPGPAQILAASLRQMDQIVALARHGVSVFTLLPPLAEELIDNTLSRKAALEFENHTRSTEG